jgi:hypothetical protein
LTIRRSSGGIPADVRLRVASATSSYTPTRCASPKPTRRSHSAHRRDREGHRAHPAATPAAALLLEPSAGSPPVPRWPAPYLESTPRPDRHAGQRRAPRFSASGSSLLPCFCRSRKSPQSKRFDSALDPPRWIRHRAPRLPLRPAQPDEKPWQAQDHQPQQNRQNQVQAPPTLSLGTIERESRGQASIVGGCTPSLVRNDSRVRENKTYFVP